MTDNTGFRRPNKNTNLDNPNVDSKVESVIKKGDDNYLDENAKREKSFLLKLNEYEYSLIQKYANKHSRSKRGQILHYIKQGLISDKNSDI
jgi:hypothetical protein